MARDTRIESWLKRKAVPFDYVEALPLCEIDPERSRQNQARFGAPIKRDLAETYGIEMLDGQEFPAIIVYAHAKERYTIISGNHRHEGAAQARLPSLDAYIVRTTDRGVIDILTHTANMIEGMRDSREDSIQHALHLKGRHGLTLKDAAVMCGVPERSLRTAYQLEQAHARLEKLQIDAGQFHPTTRSRLGNIQSDTALKAAASLAKEAALGGQLLDDLVTSLNAERTEDAQAWIIQQWEHRPDIQARMQRSERGKRKIKPTRDDELLSYLQRVFGHMARNTPGTRVAPHQRPVLLENWRRLTALMTEYLGVEEDVQPTNGAARCPAPVAS